MSHEIWPSQIGECVLRWPVGRPLREDIGCWRVAYLKPRNEKALARDCERMEIGFFLPLFEKRKRRDDTNKYRKSILPMFSSYFPYVNREANTRRIKETSRVVNILDVRDQEGFVRDLNQIWQAIASGSSIEKAPAYEAGQKVIVKNGPLQGLAGAIQETTKQRRLLLNVEAFQMAVSVELDCEDVEPL